MRPIVIVVPGRLDTPTGGYIYNRRMVQGLSQCGWSVEVRELDDSFPYPTPAALEQAARVLADLSDGTRVLVDGLALGAMPEAARRLRANHVLVGLVHHPLALETGLTEAQANILRASEKAALAAAKHVVVTSEAMAQRLVTDYSVPGDKITVARPGNDIVASASGNRDGAVHVLSVGAVVPRKGFDVLVAALATLPDLPWHLTVAGDRGRDAKTAAQLDSDIARLRLGERVTVLGAVSAQRIAELYAEADIFALASRFEGYGMAYSEAIAHGLPVIGTKAGAIPDTVPANAGILVEPDNVPAFAVALRRLIADADERKRFAAGARAAAAKLPTWQDSAKIVARTLEALT
jgi:glycosyltransferase involved in cell wall biosynthesis